MITFPVIPEEIRIMPSSFRMPSPCQMIVSPILRSRGSFQWSVLLITMETESLRD